MDSRNTYTLLNIWWKPNKRIILVNSGKEVKVSVLKIKTQFTLADESVAHERYNSLYKQYYIYVHWSLMPRLHQWMLDRSITPPHSLISGQSSAFASPSPSPVLWLCAHPEEEKYQRNFPFLADERSFPTGLVHYFDSVIWRWPLHWTNSSLWSYFKLMFVKWRSN